MRKSPRRFVLLEIMLAMGLLAIASVPLTAPYFIVIEQELKFLRDLEIERLIPLCWYDMHKQEFLSKLTWKSFQNVSDPVTGTLEKSSSPLPGIIWDYQIEFKLTKQKQYPKKEETARYRLALVELNFYNPAHDLIHSSKDHLMIFAHRSGAATP